MINHSIHFKGVICKIIPLDHYLRCLHIYSNNIYGRSLQMSLHCYYRYNVQSIIPAKVRDKRKFGQSNDSYIFSQKYVIKDLCNKALLGKYNEVSKV